MNAKRYRLARVTVGAALAAAVAAGPVRAQSTTRVSVNSFGVAGNQSSAYPALSADGRFVAFASMCLNFGVTDNNGDYDVFVHDRFTGVTECVSVDANGATGNGGSGWPGSALSADGRYVAFQSMATNLIPGGTQIGGHVYVRDRLLGTTERVSVDSNGNEGDTACMGATSISADGRYVAFDDASSNLAPGKNGIHQDCYVRDRVAGTTERVSCDSNGVDGIYDSVVPFISADGRYVAFQSSASNLVDGDQNNTEDVFVRDRTAGTTEVVSAGSAGDLGDNASSASAISPDGRFVVFTSWATNLVAGDTNGFLDVFVRDRSTGVNERISLDAGGGESDEISLGGAISADGRFIAFWSLADDLVAGDTNLSFDVFRRDRALGTTERVSVDSSGAEGDATSWAPSLSADGKQIAFTSDATNLVAGDTNGAGDCFLRDLEVASWTNYGTGFAGSYGVPAFTARASPVLGTTVTLDLANSLSQPTVGALLVGLQRAQIPTTLGGDLLVAPLFLVPISFSYGADSFTWSVPLDLQFEGLVLDLQALESDPGAAKGVSFTAGLELVLGV
jgi:Tol biopolymer transport system component